MIARHTTPPAVSIRIRAVRADDIDTVYEAVEASRAEISRYMGWCTPDYSRDTTAQWVAASVKAWQRLSEYPFLIEDGDGRVLGSCGLNRIEPQSGVANLGYWVRSSATGRGVCTAAVEQLRQFAFKQTSLYRLEIVAAVSNIASQRVAEKVGAVREGILRKRLLAGGVRLDAVLYSILRSDA